MKFCSCEKPLPPSNPRRSGCNRCGFRIPPPPEPRPIVHHCGRCLDELQPGFTGGMLYEVNGGVTKTLVYICSTCIPDVIEFAVQGRPPQHH